MVRRQSGTAGHAVSMPYCAVPSASCKTELHCCPVYSPSSSSAPGLSHEYLRKQHYNHANAFDWYKNNKNIFKSVDFYFQK